MLSNGWYWSEDGYMVMAYHIPGWRIRCRWEELLSGRWALRLTVMEEDPAPWIPGPMVNPVGVEVRPEVCGHRSWGFPDPRVMEELSRRAGPKRVEQVVACCRRRMESAQVSN